MIKREALQIIKTLQKTYPVISITGPRQSGKTTLAKMAFPEKKYVNLETPSQLDRVLKDPIGFLARHKDGAILDEVQNGTACEGA